MDEPRAADVLVLTEEELGLWRREQGHRIIQHGGRLWWDHRGFCRPLHFAATVPAQLAERPTGRCWAYHSLLPESDRALANASSPLHLMGTLSAFDELSLGSAERNRLRRAREAFRLVKIDAPELLLKQGWQIFSENARRTGLYRHVTERSYLAGIPELVSDPRRLVLGAMDGDRLLGYEEAYAVDDTAYLKEIRLSDEATTRHVSGFLYFEFLQLYRGTGRLSQVCAGLPLLQRPGVSDFKRRWGVPLVERPARFWAPAPARALLKRFAPDTYYWATGVKPPDSPARPPH